MKHIVHKIEPHMNRDEVLATTYQMRNFYQQFHDGFITNLDVMNYIQHDVAVSLAKPDDKILDMCCGRGLLLPLLRYQKPMIDTYVGVDIEPSNAVYRTKRVTDNKPLEKDYYPFKVYFKPGNVAEMSSFLPPLFFTYIVYTASIEHMHHDAGLQSLYEARKVATDGARMLLTCPRTEESQDGYDTRYSAHVYEWKLSELRQGLNDAGWKVTDQFGLLIGASELRECLEDQPDLRRAFERQRQYIPWKWLSTYYALLFPTQASEVALIAETK